MLQHFSITQNKFCMRVPLELPINLRLKIFGHTKTLENIKIISKLGWGTQSPFKSETFINNGEKLSKSRRRFSWILQFYFIFHYLLCFNYFAQRYLQNKLLFVIPSVWYTLQYFEISHDFNIFLKLLMQIQSKLVAKEL